MKFKEGVSGLPTGKAQELEINKETLPAIEVKNEVLWVSPDLGLPFKLEEGKPTQLGVFLSKTTKEGNEKSVEVEIDHKRSAIFGRVIFGDNGEKGHRQLFRDIDIKGLGYILYTALHMSQSPQFTAADIRAKDNDKSSWGILDLNDARKDAAMAEMFHEKGIRTCRAASIIILEEIVYKGEKISIEEAKLKGLIPDSVTPALEIRAFGTHTRFLDVVTAYDSELKRNLLIEDARLLVAQELGEDPLNFDIHAYFTWLARTTGKNIGLMHKNGFKHGYLDMGHNITLDGCLVDFDSVEEISKDKKENKSEYMEDYNGGHEALRHLLTRGMGLDYRNPIIMEVLKEYDRSYKESNPNILH